MNLTYLEIDHNRSSYDALVGDAKRAFIDQLMLGWMFHDHALEGVVLTHEDLRRALSGQPVRNYVENQTQKSLLRLREAALDLFEWAHGDTELTMDFIKEMHERLCDDDCEHAGRYRKRDTSPGVYHLDVVPQGSISYYFRRMMEMWEEELQFIHPIRAAAIMHWEFMRAFPFDEKTGVVGRLLMNAILIRGGYPPAIIHQMDRQTYFDALNGRREEMIPVIVEAIRATIECATDFGARYAAAEQRQVAY